MPLSHATAIPACARMAGRRSAWLGFVSQIDSIVALMRIHLPARHNIKSIFKSTFKNIFKSTQYNAKMRLNQPKENMPSLVLAEMCASISELKKDPMGTVAAGAGLPVIDPHCVYFLFLKK